MKIETDEKWETRRGSSGMLSIYSDNPDKQTSICACGGDYLPENVIYAQAISALPNLLAACKEFVDLWPVVDGDIKATPEVKHCWNLAKEAIAKAIN